MLKKRIVAVLIVKNNIVVQSIGFKKYLPIGKPAIAVEFLNSWGIDEIVLLDVDKSKSGTSPNINLVNEVSNKCFVPLTVGGGIKTVNDMKRLIQAGADKISINTSAIYNPEIIKAGSEIFGKQCMVVSLDVILQSDGKYRIFSHSGLRDTNRDLLEFAIKCEQLGAGELLVNSIERDGMRTGFDLNLAKQITETVNIPVIICGGAGHPAHLKECLEINKISGVAAANFFHYTEHSVIIDKSFLKINSMKSIRLDTYASYQEFDFDEDTGRILKKNESKLENLLYEYHPKEII